MKLEMETENIQSLCQKTEDNALYTAVVKALTGHPLAELETFFSDWSQHWPVINSDLCLTGEVSEGEEGEINYMDRAMIDIGEAIAGGWVVDREDGYAYPNDVTLAP